jgi:hypothetical protein
VKRSSSPYARLSFRKLEAAESVGIARVETALVEDRDHLSIGVVVEEPVDLRDYVGFRLPELPGVQGQGQVEISGRPTAKADMGDDALSLEHCHVFDHEPNHPLPLSV